MINKVAASSALTPPYWVHIEGFNPVNLSYVTNISEGTNRLDGKNIYLIIFHFHNKDTNSWAFYDIKEEKEAYSDLINTMFDKDEYKAKDPDGIHEWGA